jgi:hypothetical protein
LSFSLSRCLYLFLCHALVSDVVSIIIDYLIISELSVLIVFIDDLSFFVCSVVLLHCVSEWSSKIHSLLK